MVYLLYIDLSNPFLPTFVLTFLSFISPPSVAPQFAFQFFLSLDVPLGAENLHKAPTPRVKEKRAAKGEKGREKGKGKIEGKRSQKRREEEEEEETKHSVEL